VTIVERCPSGALHYTRKDGAAEQPDAANTVTVRANGPLYVRGDVTLRTDAGELRLTDTRMALCRCGQSKNKPFCDNSHREAGFSDAGAVKEKAVEGFAPGGPLTITATPNGSLQVEGAVEVIGAGGVEQAQATKTWLCRCGGSANKPFCDGTHKRNGFQG
jgi:CDGSH-type Zn-finger protein